MDINPQPIDTNLGEPVVEITPDPETPHDEDSARVVVKQQREVILIDKTIGELKSEISVLEDINQSRQAQIASLQQEISDNQKQIDEKVTTLNDYLLKARTKIN